MSVGFQESSEVAFLMIDECDECNEKRAIVSYEDDLPYIQTTEDQNIQDSIFDTSSYVSCFEMFFEEEISSFTGSECFEDQEHIEVHHEERSTSQEKDTLFLQQEDNLHVFSLSNGRFVADNSEGHYCSIQ